MPAKQRMRVANEKHSQNVTTRGNVPKSLVSSISYSREGKPHTPWKMKLIWNMKLVWMSTFPSILEATRGEISCWTYSSWIVPFRRLWIWLVDCNLSNSIGNFYHGILILFYASFVFRSVSLGLNRAYVKIKCDFLFSHSNISDHPEY